MSEDRARHHLYRAGVSVLMNGTLAHRGDIDLSEGVFAAMEALASEREAIGRAAGREEAAKVCDESVRRFSDAENAGDDEAEEAWHGGMAHAAVTLAAAIRALPVDGGKDGA